MICFHQVSCGNQLVMTTSIIQFIYRSTNMRADALIQILQKANRLEHLSGYEGSIRTVKCSKCGQGKHYLTCLQAL